MPNAQSLTPSLASHSERLVLWAPVALMPGIGAYFALPGEPSAALCLGVLAAAALLLALSWGKTWRPAAAAAFLGALGFAAADWRTQRVETPLLAQELRMVAVEGRIHEIDLAEKGMKLVLESPRVEGLAAEKTPRFVRFSLRGKDQPDMQPGDTVRLRGTVYPLPRQAMPGAFDFARYFYFKRIGAVGFAIGKAEVTQKAARGGFEEWLTRLRYGIAADMIGAMRAPEGAVAAALTMGDQGAVPDGAQEAMRASGLAHVLSISGLHMALAAGILFFSIRLLLAAWPPLSLRLPVKKIAALGALLGAAAYLLLAGSPVPAQRSFVMAAFVLAAVMLDRRGISLYSLAWAAVFILLLYPESMLGASFQMSFAATLAIIGFYETFGHLVLTPRGAWWRRGINYLLGISATSLAATLATAPFVIYHFSRMSGWGLLANTLVMPLSGFLIMPGVVASLALMPFGLQSAGYWFLETGVRLMLALAEWTASLPYATFLLHPLSDAGLALASAGLLWLVLLQGRLRWLGAACMLAGVGSSALYAPPDVMISADGKQVLVRLEDGEYSLLKGSARSFKAGVWLRTLAREEAVPLKEAGDEAWCEDDWCEYRAHGRRMIVLKDYRLLPRACAQKPEALVVWRYVRAGECEGVSRLIDRKALEKQGAIALWWAAHGIAQRGAEQENARRPWTPPKYEMPTNDKEKDDE